MSALIKSIPFFALPANSFTASSAGAIFPAVQNAASPDSFVRAYGNEFASLKSARGDISLDIVDPRNFEPRFEGQPPSMGVEKQGRRILNMLGKGGRFSVVFERLETLGIRRIVLVPRYHRNFTASLTDEESVKAVMANYRIDGLEPNDAVITFDPEYTHSMRDKLLAISLEHELWHLHDTVEFPGLYRQRLGLISRGADADAVLHSLLHLYLRASAHRFGRASFAVADIADQRRLSSRRMELADMTKLPAMLFGYIGDALETSFAHAIMGNDWRARYCNWWLKSSYGSWLPQFINREKFFGVGDQMVGLALSSLIDSSGGLRSSPDITEMIGIVENTVKDLSVWRGMIVR